jgi:surface-anchored protein
MKALALHFFFAVACWCLPDTGHARQATNLTRYHMDFRMQYSASSTNPLGIILRFDAGTDSVTVSNWQAYIVGGAGSSNRIPGNPSFAFLGPVGAPVWILPQTQNQNLPYIGVSGEDIPPGVFDGPLDFTLRSVDGPGNFFVWQTTGAGQPPIIKMIATNGIVSPDHNKTTPAFSSHEHFNWGFSTNGVYYVTFQCSGRRPGETTNITSPETTWVFHILPLTPYELWASTNWPPATEKSIINPDADPDGDALVNLVEYATELDAHVPLRAPLPFAGITNIDGQTYGTFTFRRAKMATDVSFQPTAAPALSDAGWHPLMRTNSVEDLGSIERIMLLDSIPAGSAVNRFYRLQLLYP